LIQECWLDTFQSNIEILADQEAVWYRYPLLSDIPPLYDVFEPNYLRPALELKDTHLGELIFGHDKWRQYGMKPGRPNALTQMFAYEGKYIN
jgi:hypothetical protein